MKVLVFVDLDGTLVDISKCVEKASEEIIGKVLTFENVRELEPSFRKEIYRIAQKKYWNLTKPVEKYVRLVKLFKQLNFEVKIVTARVSEEVYEETLKILHHLDIPFDELVMRNVSEKFVDDKVWKKNLLEKYCSEYDLVLVLDDQVDNIEYFLKECKCVNVFYTLAKN